MTPKKTAPTRNIKPIVIIFGLLIFWALLIALGAVIQADTLDLRKPLIVIGTMAAFLAVWLIALATRRSGRNEKTD